MAFIELMVCDPETVTRSNTDERDSYPQTLAVDTIALVYVEHWNTKWDDYTAIKLHNGTVLHVEQAYSDVVEALGVKVIALPDQGRGPSGQVEPV